MHLFSNALFDDMFVLKLPVLEKIIRPILVYFALIVLLRVFGKREMAQLNPFDLVVLLSVSNTVQNAIIGDDNSLTGGLIGAMALFAINYLTVRFLFKHRNWHEALGGSPTNLIENGQVNHRALAKELITESDLTVVAHRQGFDDVEEIDKCVLEPGGTFFMQGKKPGSDDLQHAELVALIGELRKQVDLLGIEVRKRVN
jgi:uncharacterized membrane protein YcaP (DUF421 family)